MRRKKFIALMQVVLMFFSLIAFSYLFSDGSWGVVSAQSQSMTGCCLETVEGAICQDIPLFQNNLCKGSLIGTSCSVVDQCRTGCCYSPQTGSYSMNAPRQQCEDNSGEWYPNPSCDIPQAQLGCCVMGDNAALTNSRQCTLLANEQGFEKNFVEVAPGESCQRFVGQERKGACLTDSGDFSGEKDCQYTTRGNCNGDFEEGYLCTAEHLNTVCEMSEQTTCVEGKDQVYFLDSCGNTANVYDASRVSDQSYWETPIAPEDSCSPENSNCGNCDYLGGSICVEHQQGITQSPTYGDYTCKNLNCGNRKHGESWCVYDFDPNSGVAPVGSRNFVASCFEGQISIEGCADFGQEVCAQSTDTSFGFTEAKCLVNDWRACINANDANSYSEVEARCNENPQCIMFNDLYGEDRLKRSDGEFFAGFNPELTNTEQGSVDDLGEDHNQVIAHCVPRFTPGFQFWNPTNQIVGEGETQSSTNYGGSLEETNAICSLGSFTCISKSTRDCTLFETGFSDRCSDWEDQGYWECNYDAREYTEIVRSEDLPNLLAAMNERCRALGSCGVDSNIAGQVNQDYPGFSVQRIHIDRRGETNEDVDVSFYNLSSGILADLRRATGRINNLDQLRSSSGGLSAGDVDGVGTTGDLSSVGGIDLNTLAGRASVSPGDDSFLEVMQFAGPITLAGLSMGGWSWLRTTESMTSVALDATKSQPIMVSDLLNRGEVMDVGSAQIVVRNPQVIPKGGTYVAEIATTLSDGTTLTAGQTYTATQEVTVQVGRGQMTVTSADPNWLSNLKSVGITIAASIVGSYIGMQIGGLIAKQNNWSPGKAQQFVRFSSAVGGGAFGATATGIFSQGGFSLFGTFGASIIIAIAFIAYEAFFNDYQEQEYYIMQFNCEAWQPPRQGQCELCNNDVRPCSEYRCKSLGSNCHYFVDNGEPGYCTTINDIWSAQISPWQEVLTGENSYTDVSRTGFRIQGDLGAGVEAWDSLTFGIITDKPASCKIDSERADNYDEMMFEMESPINPDTGRSDGTHHSITLNPFAGTGSSSSLGLKQGQENEYYIRCMNFAGEVNDAPFVVQVRARDGPDLTPADLRRFDPEDGSYLKKQQNSTSVVLYLNEPAECRFNYDFDVASGPDFYQELENQMTCLTSPNADWFGEWRCFAELENLTAGTNNFYFRCKDQPDLVETEGYQRNVNFASKQYTLNVCETGLEISLLNSNTFIEEPNFTLSVSTSGCLGDAVCSFRMSNVSEIPNQFFNTGGTIHSQLLRLPEGNHSIQVLCEDEARNTAKATFDFNVFFDIYPPEVVRFRETNGEIQMITDEPAECMYSTNSSLGCNFNFESDSPSYLSTIHAFNQNPLETYYIKCRDEKLNTPSSCSTIVRAVGSS